MGVIYSDPVLTLTISQSQHLNYMSLITMIASLKRQMQRFPQRDGIDSESIFTQFSFDSELRRTDVYNRGGSTEDLSSTVALRESMSFVDISATTFKVKVGNN
jgi:hypothetical protein